MVPPPPQAIVVAPAVEPEPSPDAAAPAKAPVPEFAPLGTSEAAPAPESLEAALPEPEPPPAPAEDKVSLSELCRETRRPADLVDSARQRLQETFCGATLWLDGLFGGEPDVDNARAVSGRAELTALYTEDEGFDPKARLRLHYDLPNLERRLKLFLGRDDEDEFVQDRREGLAIRSSVFGLEGQEKWLAGLGYSPPGRWAERVDFRLGARVKTAPEIFVQTRYRRNVFLGDRTVWRLRETVFWENRDGFGSTSSVDFDRVLRRDLLFRWGAVATVSEATEGAAWRNAAVLYRNLQRSRAVAGELFWRGATGAEVRLREYGGRAIVRFPLRGRMLMGETVVGYTFPRRYRDEPRKGSAMLGFGVELLFGDLPY